MDKLSTILPILQKLVSGNSLDRSETKNLFETIFLHDKEGYYFTAAMSALHAKGESPGELSGIVDVFKKLSPRTEINAEVTDTSGTGGGTFKSINVSTAVAFIVASASIRVAKASYYGVTSKCGSADLLKRYKIDISRISSIHKLLEVLKETGVVFYYTPYISPKLENRGKLFKKVFIENNLKVKSPFHLTTNAFSPLLVKKRVYGVYNRRFIKPLAKMFALLNYDETFVFSTELGLPEVSLSGKTYVIHQKGESIKEFSWTPKDFGLKEVPPEYIKFMDIKHSTQIFKSILQGHDESPYAQLVWMNAAVVLYLFNRVKSLKEGVKLARNLCKNKKPWNILKRLQRIYQNV